MSGPQSLTNDVDLDLKGLFGALWRKKFLLLLITLLGAAGLFAFLSTLAPKYRSDAQILVTQRESVFTRIRTENIASERAEFDEQAVNSQVLVLSSDDLAVQVIRRLGLEKNPEFASSGGIFSSAGRLDGTSDTPSAAVDQVDPRVLKKFKDALSVYNADGSRVIVVGFSSESRQLARDVPNTLAELYLEFTRNARIETDASATDWLGPEIEKLRANVQEAEAKVAEFRGQSDILLGSNNSLLATQQLSEVSSELSRLRAERSAAEARVETIANALNAGGSLDVVPEVINSSLVQRLRERQVDIQAQISDLSTTLLPNHPRIRALRSQLPEIEAQIRKAADDIRRSLESQVERLRKQEEVLIQEVNRYKSESARVGEAEVQLRALEREAAAQRERLEGYLVRFNEAESRQRGGYVPNEAKIIEHAVLPADAYFPKIVPFTAAGTTALLVLTMIAILAAELLSGRAFRPVGPVRAEDYPIAVDMPEIDEARASIASPNDRPDIGQNNNPANAGQGTPVVRISDDMVPSIAPDEHDLMRQPAPDTTVASAANDTSPFPLDFAIEAILAMPNATIAIASADGQEHNALFTAVIARMMSLNEKSVVVVDFSGSGSTARRMLGTLPQAGILDMAAGKVKLGDVVFRDQQSSVHVIAPGNLGRGPTDLSGALSQLSGIYDCVICDCGDAGVEGISRLIEGDMVVAIPTVDTIGRSAAQLEKALNAAGIMETVIVRDESRMDVSAAS